MSFCILDFSCPILKNDNFIENVFIVFNYLTDWVRKVQCSVIYYVGHVELKHFVTNISTEPIKKRCSVWFKLQSLICQPNG